MVGYLLRRGPLARVDLTLDLSLGRELTDLAEEGGERTVVRLDPLWLGRLEGTFDRLVNALHGLLPTLLVGLRHARGNGSITERLLLPDHTGTVEELNLFRRVMLQNVIVGVPVAD